MAINKYLEERGIKYLAAIATILYIIGTFIFNIYLRSLGIFEFEIIQLRYIFIGFTFSIFFGVFIFLIWFFRFIFWKISKKEIPEKNKKKFYKNLEIFVFILIVPGVIFYSLFIFPKIPSGFGGGKPIIARLVGSITKIRQVNAMIARETEVSFDKLPYEIVRENTDLAIGANVKILDKNKDRIFLILTKELYLSSTSELARSLIAAGENIETEETKNIKQKPLIVNAKNIEGITLSLYEPPKILTSNDLQIAAQVIATKPDSASMIIENFINTEEEKISPEIYKAVEKIQKDSPQIIEKNKNDIIDPNQKNDDKILDNKEKTNDAEKIKKDAIANPVEKNKENQVNIDNKKQNSIQAIEKIFEQNFNKKFLDFRADIFNQAIILADREKIEGKLSIVRFNLIKQITASFKEFFPEAWEKINLNNNYLVLGQNDKDFPQKLIQIFRGAKDEIILIQRINSTPAITKEIIKSADNFIEIRDGALELIQKSSFRNTKTNRKTISQILVNYFSKKARIKKEFWGDTKYLSMGRSDLRYIDNMKKILKYSDSWETFGLELLRFYEYMNTENKKNNYSGSGETF